MGTLTDKFIKKNGYVVLMREQLNENLEWANMMMEQYIDDISLESARRKCNFLDKGNSKNKRAIAKVELIYFEGDKEIFEDTGVNDDVIRIRQLSNFIQEYIKIHGLELIKNTSCIKELEKLEFNSKINFTLSDKECIIILMAIREMVSRYGYLSASDASEASKKITPHYLMQFNNMLE